MRRLMIAAGTLTALLAGSPAFSMGGGMGGGGMGYGSMMGSGAPAFDDYAVALRLIHHEQYADAIPHLEAALAQRPHNADILNYLGYTERMTGNYPMSLDFYKRALAEDPDHKGVHEYLGELYLKMNDQASAQKELQTLASLCPSGCDERDALTKALAAYVPPAGTPSTGVAAAPSAPGTASATSGDASSATSASQ